ncbi:MAG: ATP-dependent metallopeptidase FtsH/Yme1/Tma family protein [Elusimicrobia bacterium]|nr:ATP-dependent metallopeptidase FtsH/Yme1/Tma family protein [Elusimicrobiota bacterium]
MKAARQLVLWLLVFAFVFFIVQAFQGFPVKTEVLPYSEFKRILADGGVERVVVRNDMIRGQYKDSQGVVKNFRTVPLPDSKLVENLETAHVKYEGEAERSWVTSLLFNFGWIVLIFGAWWFLIARQMQMGGRQALSFGRSRAKLANQKKQKVTFVDVAGTDEAKEELNEIIEFLKNPQKFQKLGGRIPKGVLLYGVPGCGKTLLAKAVAGEAGVPFYSTSGSEFVEMFVGVGAARVRDLFEQARKTPPAVVFVDELDAVGRYRFAGIGGGHDEREQTLNQLLVELDGFDTKEGIVLIAATNRPDVLDPALLRPGRFDRHVHVAAPDLRGREEILTVHSKKVKMAQGVELKTIAQRTPGFVGSDLANVVNEAALLAARRDKTEVGMGELEDAIDRVVAGPQRKSRLISEKEKKIIAYHEAGHTLVAKSLPNSDPVHKVTIVPRGPALGYTLQLPTEDRYLTTRSELVDRLAVLLGGRCAEEIIFGDITTGAQDDLSKATAYAQRMVTEFGMSEKLGPVTYKKKDEEVFLGRDLVRSHQYSDMTAERIDSEVLNLVESARARARQLLEKSRASLDLLATKLVEKEVLDSDEIDQLIRSAVSGMMPQPQQA